MSGVDDNTPVIIGVGQVSERVGEEGYRERSPMDLAGDALAAALADAQARRKLAPANQRRYNHCLCHFQSRC